MAPTGSKASMRFSMDFLLELVAPAVAVLAEMDADLHFK